MPFNEYSAVVASNASALSRTTFIRKTYLHLAGAVGAFLVLEALILSTPLGAMLAQTAFGTRFGWFLFLGAFMLAGHVAQRWAQSEQSTSTQYLGLGLYVVAQALLMAPMLLIAASVAGPEIIFQAGVYTVLLFAGLTGTVFFMKADFSFMRGVLVAGSIAALATIVLSMVFGFSLGLLFTGLMVLLAAGYILYDTSNVLHHYPVSAHVAASLALFASVALLFWYVLQFLLRMTRR